MVTQYHVGQEINRYLLMISRGHQYDIMCNYNTKSMEHVFCMEAMVREYHEYQSVWDAPIGETLLCEREVDSVHDTFAVAIKKEGKLLAIVQEKSQLFAQFL